MDEDALTVSQEEDPMKFIGDSVECHDWSVKVVDPDSHSEREFSIISTNLAAHSSVFRKMMTDPKWVKEKRLVIPNMSPQTFDLIYRYVNAGELGLQKLSREDMADLALAADMYMIPRLVRKACKHLKPSKVEELFPALTVVSFIQDTELDPHVAKFVQLDTQGIMVSAKFLRLDGRCIEFIMKQENLSLPELELWKNLVNWARHQVADDEKKTLRTVLGGALKYVRFRTLTQEEIAKEVAPTSVLSGEELSSLLCAVIGKQPWNQSGLCGSEVVRQPERTITDKTIEVVKATSATAKNDIKVEVFKTQRTNPYEFIVASAQTTKSHFTIETKKNIELQSFVIKPKPLLELQGTYFYSMKCLIEVKSRENGCYCSVCNMTTNIKELFGGDEVFVIPTISSSDNQLLKLEANRKYHFTVNLTPAHTAFDLSYGNNKYCTTQVKTVQNVMTVQYHSIIHVQEIHYKILP